jgi:hypothetical protein
VADNVTWFALELVPEGWFAAETQADGWFDRDLLDIAAGGAVTGTLAATDGADVAAFAGDVLIDGVLAATEVGLDTAAFAGDVLIDGVLAAVETGDVAAFAGDVLVQGQLAATEDGLDIAAFEGSAAASTKPDRGDASGKTHVRRLILIRPKPERQLDEVLEEVQAAANAERPRDKRERVKAARALLKAIAPLPSLAPAFAAIDAGLAQAARAAGVHQGFAARLMVLEARIDELAAGLERARLKRKRDEEALIWLTA